MTTFDLTPSVRFERWLISGVFWTSAVFIFVLLALGPLPTPSRWADPGWVAGFAGLTGNGVVCALIATFFYRAYRGLATALDITDEGLTLRGPGGAAWHRGWHQQGWSITLAGSPRSPTMKVTEGSTRRVFGVFRRGVGVPPQLPDALLTAARAQGCYVMPVGGGPLGGLPALFTIVGPAQAAGERTIPEALPSAGAGPPPPPTFSPWVQFESSARWKVPVEVGARWLRAKEEALPSPKGFEEHRFRVLASSPEQVSTEDDYANPHGDPVHVTSWLRREAEGRWAVTRVTYVGGTKGHQRESVYVFVPEGAGCRVRRTERQWHWPEELRPPPPSVQRFMARKDLSELKEEGRRLARTGGT